MGCNLATVRGCAFLHPVRHPTPPDVSSKLLRRLLLAPVVLFLILELILWLFVRIPLEPLKRLDLSNELPGLKPDVRLVFDRNLTRYLDDAAGNKPPGTIRILCLGGSGTFAMLQNAEDAWWGQLGRQLQAKGYPVQVAAWGQDRTGIVASTAVAAVLMDESGRAHQHATEQGPAHGSPLERNPFNHGIQVPQTTVHHFEAVNDINAYALSFDQTTDVGDAGAAFGR